MDSRLRGNDRLRNGPASFVVPAKAGTYTSNQGWIPAYAESTPPSTPLGYNNNILLGGIEQKSSGGMTEGSWNEQLTSGRLPPWILSTS